MRTSEARSTSPQFAFIFTLQQSARVASHFTRKFHVSSNYTAFTSEMKIDASRAALDEKKFDLYHEKKHIKIH